MRPSRFCHVMFPGEVRPKHCINFGEPAPPFDLRPMPDPGLPHDQAAFVSWLFSLQGLDASAYRSETLQRRLPSCLRSLRVRSLAEARRLLELEPALAPAAISAMLVGVTSFFRDPPVFAALETEILPELIKGRAGLHVWSAGCSDGAELYSLGMLFAVKGWLASSYLLGTDCRPDAISRARTGVFDALACKNVPTELRTRFLVCESDDYRVVAPLRLALRWRVADLLQVQEPGVWDLILCRNTTMYLRTEASLPLWRTFEQMLRPGGVLILGKAERPVGVKRLTPIGYCMYRRQRG